ncbi:MAG: hypothetical protein BroJett006_09380 [Betaproteobacteria bacterium]|nr:MAG: hypothetical protein BroJett006_09380 [Betaproteobacteria bacterium]
MDLWTWVAVFAVIAILGGIFSTMETSKKKKAMDGQLSAIPDFAATWKIMGNDAKTGLAIDEHRNLVCLIDNHQSNMSYRIVPYKDLLSCEIFEDGSTVTKTMRTSQIGGALVGALALGGVGAIIGGLSGKTKTTGKIKRVDLRITVNDTQNPHHDVNFISHETQKGGIVYDHAIKEARQWHGLIEVLIKRADQEDQERVGMATALRSISLADELKKLAELRNSGVLDDEEFQQQKTKLLNS